MRNRKFKAWDHYRKEMRYSDRHDGEFYVNTKGVMYIYYIPDTHSVVKTYNVLEWTGFKDIKGNDIYEGDYDSDGNMVVFCDNCAGWQFGLIDIPSKDLCINCHACDGDFFFQDHLGEFEIFGNINEVK